MSELDRRILEFLALGWDRYEGGPHCYPFKPIHEAVGVPIPEVRRRVRRLARKGLAEYQNGLWTEDGEPAGAGYGITHEGMRVLGEQAA